tara:strand:+ start:151 stop:390 length:240 start_codon:yes stop_codon:yes gene_type:complete
MNQSGKPIRPVKLNILVEPNEYLIMKAIKEVHGATLSWQLDKAKEKYIAHAKQELIVKHGYKINAEGEISKHNNPNNPK